MLVFCSKNIVIFYDFVHDFLCKQNHRFYKKFKYLCCMFQIILRNTSGSPVMLLVFCMVTFEFCLSISLLEHFLCLSMLLSLHCFT